MSVLRLGWRGVAYGSAIAVAATLIVAWWPQFSVIWSQHLLTFLSITLLMAASIVVQARNFTSFLPGRGGPGLAAMAHTWALGALVNYLGPFQPGLPLRVALLARVGIPVAESSVATIRQVFASLWLSLMVAAVSLLWLQPVAMAVPALGLILIFAAISKMLPTIRHLAARALVHMKRPGLREHSQNAIALPGVRSALGVLTQYALSATMFLIGYRQFGVDIGFAAAFGLASVVYASSVVALLPGNFGVLEALCTGFGQVNGLSVDESLALAFLYRGANLAGALLLAAIPMPLRTEAI